MALPRHPEKAVLFVGCLSSDEQVFKSTLPALTEQFGSILYQSQSLLWEQSSYYNDELGTPISRTFVFFEKIIDPVTLVEAKLHTNSIESDLSQSGRRRINLDPGYMTLAKVVLASLKNYSHRIYLGSSVYGELELFYKDDRFNPMPYTYFDYRDEAVINIFSNARKLLRKTIPTGPPAFLL
jgi:hypothetical protein